MPVRGKLTRRFAGGCALALCLAACGGESGSSSTPGQTLIVAPSPTPTPPAPTPTPTPTPTPPHNILTTSPDMIAGVLPGGWLFGPRICGSGSASYVRESDGTQRLSAFSSVTTITSGGLSISYAALDKFVLEGAGFGGPTFAPADKKSAKGATYDYFRNGDEFEIYRTGRDLLFATLGRTNGEWTDSSICFYAAGPLPANLPTSNGWHFYGLADGLALRGGRTERLFGSSMLADYDGASRELTVRLTLKGRDAPFGDFANSPTTDITTATARITLPGLGFGTATLTGADGSTGTISGNLFGNNGVGIGLVFELRYPNGDRIFGAIAGDMNLI